MSWFIEITHQDDFDLRELIACRVQVTDESMEASLDRRELHSAFERAMHQILKEKERTK